MFVMFCVCEFEMSFEYLSENHLNSSDHASPAVIGLYLFDAFAISEPEGGPEVEQKFISLLGRVLFAQKLGSWSIGSYFYLFAAERVGIGVFDGVQDVCFDFSKFVFGGVDGRVEGVGELIQLVGFLEVRGG